MVHEVWDRFTQASPEEAQALAQRMQSEQPYLMAYLLVADEEFMDEQDRGVLLMLGAWIWQVMSQGDKPLRMVRHDDLDRAEQANMRTLEELDQGPELAVKDAIHQLVTGYNQMPLLGAVLEALMAGHEEEPESAPDSLGLALLHLKTVIDCLDQ